MIDRVRSQRRDAPFGVEILGFDLARDAGNDPLLQPGR